MILDSKGAMVNLQDFLKVLGLPVIDFTAHDVSRLKSYVFAKVWLKNKLYSITKEFKDTGRLNTSLAYHDPLPIATL